MTEDVVTGAAVEEEIALPENVYNTRVEENNIYFYTQSQSPRAWATFVTPEVTKKGLSYDASSLKVHVKPAENPEEPYFLPVQCLIFEDEKELTNYVNDAVNNGFTKLEGVTFKNLFSNSPITLALGYYHYESWKKLFPAGYKFIKITPLVAPAENPQAVALAIVLI